MLTIFSRGIWATCFVKCFSVFVMLGIVAIDSAQAQDLDAAQPVESTPAGLIDFNRDIRPILEASCTECHGPKVAKEGFRADEKESMLAYVEPGDSSASSLWTDYLVSADEETRMPPVSQNRPLTGGQLATLKLWIEEGAKWDDPAVMAAVAPPPPKSKFKRITTFMGLFHPAAVHFPVALLLISAVFLVGSFVYRDAFESAAFHCLWIGAVSACVSCVLGWFFAEGEGYPNMPNFDFSKGIERHRWTAILLSIMSIAMIPVAVSARRTPNNYTRRLLWLVGASLLAILVSIAGHQGGEMVHGEDLYTPAFKAIFEEPTQLTK